MSKIIHWPLVNKRRISQVSILKFNDYFRGGKGGSVRDGTGGKVLLGIGGGAGPLVVAGAGT